MAAACRWLAGNGVPRARLILYAAVFPAEMDRRATLVALPEQPVLVVNTAPDAAGNSLLADWLAVGTSVPGRASSGAGPGPPAALLGPADA